MNNNFEPSTGEEFYYISSEMFILPEEWEDGNMFHVDLYTAGNCFESYQQAEMVREQFKSALLRYN